MIKTVKFILVGDVSVGKTSLLQSFEHETFTNDHEPTIGLAFSQKNVRVNGEDIQMQLWDTAGQEEYRALTKSYYRNSACVILVFDITNMTSFKNLDTWLKDIHANTHEEIVLTLVGNKADCNPELRQVFFDNASRYSQITKMHYVEASAKSGLGVKDVFE
jgi:small GTP-binding protein